jgi:hypothetical protein
VNILSENEGTKKIMGTPAGCGLNGLEKTHGISLAKQDEHHRSDRNDTSRQLTLTARLYGSSYLLCVRKRWPSRNARATGVGEQGKLNTGNSVRLGGSLALPRGILWGLNAVDDTG